MMLSKTKIIATVILSGMLLMSCSSNTNKPDKAQLEELTQITDTGTQQSSHENLGSWLEPETSYENTSSDSLKGIKKLPHNGFLLWYDDNLVFQTVGENSTLYMYINNITGEPMHLCPDPLCHHNSDDRCLFMTIMNITTDNESDGKLYIAREVVFEKDTPPYEMLSEVMDDGSLRDVFGHKNEFTEEGYRPYNFYDKIIAHNDLLYFTEVIRMYNHDGRAAEDTATFYIVDSETGNIEYSCDESELPGAMWYVGDDYYLFAEYSENTIFVTDMNFENRRDIYSYVDSVHIYMDDNTGEIFIEAMEFDDDGNSMSVLYSCDEDWNLTPVNMSTNQIMNIFITREYIYFEQYQGETMFGRSPMGGECIDNTGGIIYRLRRDNLMAEPEIVFDGHGEIYNYGYMVVGDNLYIKYKELAKDGGQTWWRITGDLIRVNMKNNTIKWINADS